MLVEVVGTAASVVALAAATVSGWRWWETHRARRLLTGWVHRLYRLDRRLVAVVCELDAALAVGVGWAGWAIWPHQLAGRITYLDGLVDDLERSRAELRAIDANGGTERLRADVERMADLLRLAAVTYRAGTIESYREVDGAQMPPGATGREPTPTLGTNDVAAFAALRDEFTLVARTVAHRLDDGDRAERYRALWPVQRSECALDIEQLWGSEPRPSL